MVRKYTIVLRESFRRFTNFFEENFILVLSLYLAVVIRTDTFI